MYLSAYVVQSTLFRACLVMFLFIGSCGKKQLLREVKPLPHYPSASGIEYFNNQCYIIGDDASYLLVLDSNLNPVDSIVLYSSAEKRIPKAIKPDLEAITLLPDKKLLLTGSGSLPSRNIAWVVDPLNKQKDSIRLDTFYSRLVLYGISELNIEGAAVIPGGIVLSNRGSKGFPKNHLVFTKKNFWERQAQIEINTAFAGVNADSSSFSGISGLAYSAKSDCLLMTVSTEDTRNSYDDGAIGKSYLWIVKNISAKKNWKAINPNKIIDLGEMDSRFKGQKIESVCIRKESSNMLYLVLAADNDNGSSTLFQLAVSKD